MAAGHGLWQDCVPSLAFPRLHQARAFSPLLFTMDLGFPGDQWTGPAPPTPNPSCEQLTLRGGGGGWAACRTPAPLPCFPGPVSLGLLLGWEQEAVAAVEEVSIQGLATRVGSRTSKN